MTDGMIIKMSSEFELQKFDGEGGKIEAYVSTFGNADKVGDIMDTGAFDDFVKQFDEDDKQLPMLFQHSQLNVVGAWTKFVVDDKGLKGYGTIFTETSGGADALSLIKRGLIDSTSIGFRSDKFENLDDGGRLFKRVYLVETSLVLTPANPKAKITSVKEEDGRINVRKLEGILRDVDLTQKERKLLLAGGVAELMKQRDVLDEEATKQTFIERVKNLLDD